MVRALVCFVLVAVPLAGLGATPAPMVTAEPPHGGQVIDGRITGIDYRRSTLVVTSPGRGRIELTVMPSTSIQTKEPGYHAIIDLHRGEQVEVWSSIMAGRYIAQIIRVH